MFPVLSVYVTFVWLKLGSFTIFVVVFFFRYPTVYFFSDSRIYVGFVCQNKLFKLRKFHTEHKNTHNNLSSEIHFEIRNSFQYNMQITELTKIVKLECDRCDSKQNCKLYDIFYFIQFKMHGITY